MRVLVVIDHPNPGSFTHAIAERFGAGAEAAGHLVEVADLHAEGFSPVWSMADQDQGATPPEDILPEQARIERCDALCLVFPVYWYGMPAMMKGWVDRVWTYGWAYDQVGDPNASLLKDRIGVMLIPAGGNPANWEPYGFEPAMRTAFETGIMGYFGLTDKRVHFLNGSEGSEPRRDALLQRAFEVGRTLGEPAPVIDEIAPLWSRETGKEPNV